MTDPRQLVEAVDALAETMRRERFAGDLEAANFFMQGMLEAMVRVRNALAAALDRAERAEALIREWALINELAAVDPAQAIGAMSDDWRQSMHELLADLAALKAKP